MRKQILVIEDQEMILKGICYLLEENGYDVDGVSCLKQANLFIDNHGDQIDLIILDVMLPDGDGFEFYHNVISNKHLPTLFLTAKDNEDDIVKGLMIGGDDYLTKPFSSKELLARIYRILKRNSDSKIKTIGNISFDLDAMKVYKNGLTIDLTALELKLLHLLFIYSGKIVTRAMILDKIWEWTGNDVDDHSINVYIRRIRIKLDSDLIETIKGLGYRINEK